MNILDQIKSKAKALGKTYSNKQSPKSMAWIV